MQGNRFLRGFSGRAMYPGEGAKYCNTSAAQGYNCTKFLYGLHLAKDPIRHSGMVYLVEGYKDVIAMHAAGFINTVGVCGTALTGLTARIVLLPDGNRAGSSFLMTQTTRGTGYGGDNCSHAGE